MRKPSRAASFTSEAVTSFWRSTKALPAESLTCQNGAKPALSSSAFGGVAGGGRRTRAASAAVGAGAHARRRGRRRGRSARPRRRRPSCPAAACRARSAAAASSHTGRPPRCAVRWMVGVQPPETATRSQPMWRSRPSALRIERAADAPAALRFDDPAARRPAARRPPSPAARIAAGDVRPRIDDGDDLDARRGEIGDGRRGLVVVGEDDGAAAGRRGEAVEVGRAPRRPASRPAGRCRRRRCRARSTPAASTARLATIFQ